MISRARRSIVFSEVARPCVVLLLPLLLVRCTAEQLSINTRGDFTFVRESGAAVTGLMEGRVYEEMMGEREFGDAWDVVTSAASPYDALAVTMSLVGDGSGDPVQFSAALVIALPAPIRRNAHYTIGSAFPPPVDAMPLYWNRWGRHDLRQEGVAEIALRTFDYRTVGMTIENDFVATDASGFIEVISRGAEIIELRLDLTATNADGARVRLYGDLRITPERYTPPFS